MNFSRLIAEYIDSAWRNARRVLNGPQAQEELLSGARLYFHEPGNHSSAKPVAVYLDQECGSGERRLA